MTAPSRSHGPLSDLTSERAEGTVFPEHEHVAADGQHVVDQSADRPAERRAIGERARQQDTLAREERSHEPSARFWSSRRAQAGPLLALLAGVFTLAVRTWPIAVPQARGTAGVPWFLVATVAGLLYVAGFFLADRHWQRARAVLVCGAILHLLFGVLAATLVDAQAVAPGPLSVLFDAVPAIVALVAAFLITPPPGERVER
jgi:hypothetical protein